MGVESAHDHAIVPPNMVYSTFRVLQSASAHEPMKLTMPSCSPASVFRSSQPCIHTLAAGHPGDRHEPRGRRGGGDGGRRRRRAPVRPRRRAGAGDAPGALEEGQRWVSLQPAAAFLAVGGFHIVLCRHSQSGSTVSSLSGNAPCTARPTSVSMNSLLWRLLPAPRGAYQMCPADSCFPSLLTGSA